MRVGVDLGGTKIEAVALAASGQLLWRERVPTPKGDYGATVQAIVALIGRLESDLGRRGTVGMGTPGSLSRVDGRMKNCNSTVLNGRPFREDVSRALGREVRIANDADCFALSEASDGAAEGEASVFGVILGTGVGGGLAIGGRPLSGPNGICGEWGHNPMPFSPGQGGEGRPCYCGRVDCVETWLSGPGFERSYEALSGRPMPAAAVFDAAAGGDGTARECVRNYVDGLARALSVVVNIVDPSAVVLGGGMSNAPELCARVARRWERYIFSDRVDTRLLPALHGDSSGVRGAAWLWPPGAV